MVQKQPSRLLGQREEQLRLALDAARMIAFDWNLTTGVCYRSSNAAQIFGLRSNRAEEFYNSLHPDDRVKFESAVAAARSGAADYDVELRLLTPEGQTLWVLDKGKLRIDPVTQQPHLNGVCIDITERRRATREREQALATLNNLVASAPVGITLLDSEMRYQVINEPLAEMNGRSPAEHIGRTVAEIVPDALAQAEPLFWQVLQTGQSITDQILESETAMAPGVKRVFRESWFAVAGADTKPSGVGVIVEEITDARRAEERLAKKNERLALLSEASAALLHADDPNELLPTLFEKIGPHLGLDAYFHFILNETRDALRLASCVGIDEETARSLTRLELGQAICGSAALRQQPLVVNHVQQSDELMVGVVKAMGMRAYACHPLMAGAHLLGTLSFATRSRDAFDADELEFLATICRYLSAAYQRMRLVEQLRDSDRRKDEFLAVLAHELRNPLAPIRNALQLLHLANGKSEIIEQASSTMERQIVHLVRLVDDLLDMSRITSGKIQLRTQRIELGIAMGHAVESADSFIKAAAHELTVTLPPEPVHVNADPTRLGQVFSNLLTNAAKYTEPGGRIWLTGEKRGGEVVVSVRDTGIGIPSEQLPHIFDMFSQVTPALERSQGGLGIGLALVKGLVDLHGGTVEARSDGLGRGSEFHVRLPLADPTPQAFTPHGSEQESPAPSPVARILVVDDNRDSADSLGMLLQLLGHDIRAAYDGVEAVQAAAAFRPDMMLLDIGLPKMSGYEVARRIRQHDWGKRVRLIAMTGWGQEEDKRRAFEAGFDHHLTKPVHPLALQKLLSVSPFEERDPPSR
jgi:PAS domain S-box-containing protein